MKKYNLEFCFKGSRTYVQGPDIFDAVIDVLNKNDFDFSDMNDIKYTAHEMLEKNADLIVTENFKKEEFAKINSVITFKYENKKYFAIVVENENKIECSNEYSEEIVRSKSVIQGNQIEFFNILDDSITELVVSMNKYFLQKTVTTDGKWIVTKFDYFKIIDAANIKNKTLKLELTNNFNNKLTKSKIYVADEMVGNLYFSLI
jgi:hypothetical protein